MKAFWLASGEAWFKPHICNIEVAARWRVKRAFTSVSGWQKVFSLVCVRVKRNYRLSVCGKNKNPMDGNIWSPLSLWQSCSNWTWNWLSALVSHNWVRTFSSQDVDAQERNYSYQCRHVERPYTSRAHDRTQRGPEQMKPIAPANHSYIRLFRTDFYCLFDNEWQLQVKFRLIAFTYSLLISDPHFRSSSSTQFRRVF